MSELLQLATKGNGEMEAPLADDTDGKSYTVDRFCKVENIGHTTFYQEVNSGRLEARKIGSKTIILPAARRKWRANLLKYKPANDGTETREDPVDKPAVAGARQAVSA